MTSCLGKSCIFGLLCVSFVNVYQILCVFFFPFGYLGWDVGCDYIFIPDHYLFIYFSYNRYVAKGSRRQRGKQRRTG